MDITELRLGNIVEGGVVGSIGYSGGIAGCTINESEFHSFGTFKPIFEVQPQPMSIEWLKTLGFERIKHDVDEHYKTVSYRKKLDRFNYLIIESDFSFSLQEINGDESLCFENDILDTVHRLQNIWYSLTKQELNQVL